jgi:hypothetical protein
VRDNCTSVRVAVKRGSVVAQDTASDVGHLRFCSEAQLRCGTNVLCTISVMCRISVMCAISVMCRKGVMCTINVMCRIRGLSVTVRRSSSNVKLRPLLCYILNNVNYFVTCKIT